jgi:hypothetical protein
VAGINDGRRKDPLPPAFALRASAAPPPQGEVSRSAWLDLFQSDFALAVAKRRVSKPEHAHVWALCRAPARADFRRGEGVHPPATARRALLLPLGDLALIGRAFVDLVVPLREHALDVLEQLDLRAVLVHDEGLLQHGQSVVPGPVDHQAGREARQHEGEDQRHPVEDHLLRRVGRRRVELHLREHRDAHHDRPDAEVQELADHRQQRRVERNKAEQIEDVGRVGRREVLDPADERRMAHLDRDEQHLVEREEHRDLHHDRQAARERIDLLLLVQLHQRLLLLHLVVAVALADRHHLGLHRLHLRHRGVGLVGEREEQELHQHGDDQDREAEIADVAIEEVDRLEHRLGDEIEPAPVDQQLEAVEAERLVVEVDGLDLLGAGEQPRREESSMPPTTIIQPLSNVILNGN